MRSGGATNQALKFLSPAIFLALTLATGTKALAADSAENAAPAANESELEAAPQAVEPAPAESPPSQPDTPPEPKDESAIQLEEVVVTATKRVKSPREIPGTVAAVSGQELEKRGMQSVEEIVKLVPGVNITAPGDSAARITIRGIAAQSGTNATTGVLFGDVSFTDAYLPRVTLDPNPFDLQSVEVLKGPQGTLFGASALNGAIRYVLEQPAFGTWQAKYFAQYTMLEAGASEPIYGGAVNVPLGGGGEAALRLVGLYRKEPGWVDNHLTGIEDANGLTQSGARGILGWRPGDAWDLALTYAWQDSDTADSPVTDNGDGRLTIDNRPRPSLSHNDYNFADLKISYDFDWARLVSDSAYIEKRADNFFDASSRLPGGGQTPLQMAQTDDSHSETASQELRLVSPDDPDLRWQWVTGVFAARQDLYFHLDIPISLALPIDIELPPGLIPLLDGVIPGLGGILSAQGEVMLASLTTDVSVEELAWFGDVTRRLGDDWELSLGGRLYRTTSGGITEQGGLALAVVNGGLTKTIDEEIQEQGFNPKLSLLWRASRDILGYAAASRGFRVGGVQPGFTAPGSGVTPPEVFKSDTIWNYEAGLRTQWLKRTLRLDLTGFFADWKDPQVFQLDPGGLGSYLDNAGAVESKGAEGALQYLFPLPGLSLTSTAAYTKTLTTKPFTASDGNQVAPGAEWPFAPRWQTATTLAYILRLGTWNVGSFVTHSYLGKAVNNLAPTQKQEVFGYQQWDAQLGLSNPSIPWLPELSLTVNNLRDERGVTNVWQSGTVETVDVTYIRPRAITLRLSGRF